MVQCLLVDKRCFVICPFKKFFGGLGEASVAEPVEVHHQHPRVEIGFPVAETDDITQKFVPLPDVPAGGCEGGSAREPEIQTCCQWKVQQIRVVKRRDVVENDKVAVEI